MIRIQRMRSAGLRNRSVSISGYISTTPAARPGAVFQWFAYPKFTASDASHLVPCVSGSNIQWIQDLVTGTWFQQSITASQPTFNLSSGIYSSAWGTAGKRLYVPSTSLIVPTPYAIVASVINTGGTAVNSVIVDSDSTNQAAFYIGDTGQADNPTILQGCNAATFLKQSGQRCTSKSVVTLVVNGASSVLRCNGVETTGSQGSNSLNGLRIGDLRGSTTNGSPLAGYYFFNGNIQAVAVYNSALNSAQRAAEEAYFNSFWKAF